MKQEWKEIPFNFKLKVSNIKQQGVGSESLDGCITESMSQPGIKEDIYAARTPIRRQGVGSITNQKYDQPGLKEDQFSFGYIHRYCCDLHYVHVDFFFIIFFGYTHLHCCDLP
jgi:hypothetical protein